MHKEIICIACPRGCRLTITGGEDKASGETLIIDGNQCPKGADYGRQEILEPRRMLTTTVKTISPDCPRLPVRLSAEIPKAQIDRCMIIINEVIVSTDCVPGDVLLEDVIEEGVNLIATGGISFER